MAGSSEGGKKAMETNKKRYGADFPARIGAKGGRNGHTGGFWADRELARTAGAKGGRISRRKKWTVNSTRDELGLNEPVKIDHDKLDRMVRDEPA